MTDRGIYAILVQVKKEESRVSALTIAQARDYWFIGSLIVQGYFAWVDSDSVDSFFVRTAWKSGCPAEQFV